jgi:CxxC motif-containing protein (DUF1111 family)
MKRSYYIVAALCIGVLAAISCNKLLPGVPDADQVLDGPVEGLTGAENLRFLAGDIAFNDDVFTPEKGLGPIFVATSCGSCHAGDGKGHPFTTLTRFGQTDSTGNHFLNQGGPQLQNRAIPGYTPEQIPAGATSSSFTPPANTGLGFLDAIPDATILAMADPLDLNGDGISGVANWNHIPGYCIPRVGTIEINGKYICRFGKKGATYDLLQQTANAYNQDIGISSVFEYRDVLSGQLTSPEVSEQTINDVVFYLKTLKAPVQRNPNDPEVMAGAAIFNQINCSGCHTPSLQTGYSSISALAYKTIFPYTDLLLHDMGPGLDDGYTEGNATTREWRTPALWGLGLSPNSQGGQYFLLHDGRARTITDAILLHGGESLASRNQFNNLSETDKRKLIRFLESL